MGAFSSSPPSELTQALRDLIKPDEEPAPKENVARNVDLTFCFDDNSGIAASEETPPLVIHFPARINGWAVRGKRGETGSASLTVYAGTSTLTSIVASAPPSVTSSNSSDGATTDVSTWTKTLPRETTLVAVIDSISGFTKLTLSLSAKRLDL